MKVINLYLFGKNYVIRIEKNPYYKSKKNRRKSDKYWAQFDNVREFDPQQQQGEQ